MNKRMDPEDKAYLLSLALVCVIPIVLIVALVVIQVWGKS